MPTTCHLLKPESRRALELLAPCRDGCTETTMLAHGFSIDMMVELINSGLATVQGECRGRRLPRGKSAGAHHRGRPSGSLRTTCALKWCDSTQPPYGTLMPRSGRRPQHQSRRFRDVRVTSAYAPRAATKRTGKHFAFVPKVAVSNRTKHLYSITSSGACACTTAAINEFPTGRNVRRRESVGAMVSPRHYQSPRRSKG